jgi:hypothetical protein
MKLGFGLGPDITIREGTTLQPNIHISVV